MESWFLLIVLALVIAGSGFVQSSMGFGYAIVALAILPFFVDVRLANIVVSLSVLVPLTFAVWTYRHGLEWRDLAWCLSGAAVGLPVGLFVFTTFDADWLVRGTGLAIFLMAMDGLFVRHDASERSTSPVWSVVAGAASGMLSGSIGMGGPPVVAYAARQHWSATRFKVFLISFSLMLAVLRAFGLIATGWIDQTVLFYSAAAVPFGLAGGYLGTLVSRNIDSHRIRRMAMLMLLFLSVGMIIRGRPHDMSADTVSLTSVFSAFEPDARPHKAHAPAIGSPAARIDVWTIRCGGDASCAARPGRPAPSCPFPQEQKCLAREQ